MFALGAWKAVFGTPACHAYSAGFLLRSPLGFEQFSAYAPLVSPLEGLESNSINGNPNVDKRGYTQEGYDWHFPLVMLHNLCAIRIVIGWAVARCICGYIHMYMGWALIRHTAFLASTHAFLASSGTLGHVIFPDTSLKRRDARVGAILWGLLWGLLDATSSLA